MKAAIAYRLFIVLIIACTLLFGHTLLPAQARVQETATAGNIHPSKRI